MLLPFDKVSDILDEKIKYICEDVDATEPPIIYITDSETINKQVNRLRKWQGEPPLTFVPNFRYEVAKTRPYKGNRKNPKPEHFYNIVFYLMANYNVILSEDGLEADDMMCIEQARRGDETIICSRDKDLRICPGWHFSWECGNQRAIGPVHTDRIGWLEMHITETTNEKTGKVKVDKKVIGYGLKFFYYQMLVGDTADHIPGLKGWGTVGAYKLLNDLNTEDELFKAVKSEYINTMGKDMAKEYFLEQANLLWMIQQKGKRFSV